MAELTSIERAIRVLSKIGSQGYKQISIPHVKILRQKRELFKILRKDPDNIEFVNLLYKGTIIASDRTIELGEIDANDIKWKFTGQWTYGSKIYK